MSDTKVIGGGSDPGRSAVGDTEVTRRGSHPGRDYNMHDAKYHWRKLICMKEMCNTHTRGQWKKHIGRKSCDALRKEKLRNINLRS
jgi:hypothetical protein